MAELIKKKFQKPNSASYQFYLFYNDHVSSQSVILLAYSGILMASQYCREVGFSMLFSATSEVSVPQDPVTQELLSQARWPTVSCEPKAGLALAGS